MSIVPLLIAESSCGGGSSSRLSPAPNFIFSVNPAVLAVTVGTITAPAILSVQAKNGFNGAVSVAIPDPPQGISSVPEFPLILTAGQVQEVTFSIPSSQQIGSVSLQFSATSGTLSKSGTMSLNVLPQPIVETFQQTPMLFLQSTTGNESVRVGLSTAWGGSITEFSLNGTNYVNTNDPGREVQAGLWDGNTPLLSDPGFWGTVQAGDHDFDGSPVLVQTLTDSSIYVKTQPLHWIPEDFGGGSGNPVPSDVFIEQWLTPVPGHGRAFKLHYKITHFGTDIHANSPQECPAVYVNRGFDTFQYYGGSKPWTYDALSNFVMPNLPQLSPLLYTPERWGAYVDSNNSGLTVFTPTSYPYSVGFDNPGPPPDGTNDFSPFTTFTWYPGAVLDFDIYLIAGPVSDARPIIYQLQKQTTISEFSPFGRLEDPLSGATVTGTAATVDGWVFGASPVANVQILVDGKLSGAAAYGISRPDIASAFPGQTANAGYRYSLDTTAYANGSHSIAVKVTDTAGNIAIFPATQVNTSNP
jgi:hypothetical protein